MHLQSCDTCDWLPLGGGAQTRVRFCGVSESYGRAGLKPLCSRVAWLQPIGTKVENKNISGKLLSFFHRLAGRHLNPGNMGHLHEFPARGIIATYEALTIIIALPQLVGPHCKL